jgi:hypothetical protein
MVHALVSVCAQNINIKSLALIIIPRWSQTRSTSLVWRSLHFWRYHSEHHPDPHNCRSADFNLLQFYSTADVEAAAGSLLLFTGVQDTNGQIASSPSISLIPTEVPTDDWLTNNYYSLV